MTLYEATFTGRSQYRLRLDVTQGTQDVANNRTLVHWSTRIDEITEWGSYNYDSSGWNTYVNGWVGSGSFSYDFRNVNTVALGSGSTWVSHNSDGTKAIWVEANVNGHHLSAIGSASVGATFNLTTIPRASTSTWAASGTKYIGTQYTINTNRASTGFTHTLEYEFGSASGTINTGVGASTTWTPPTSLLSQIPTSESGSGIIRTKTYSGATLIGTTTSSITLTAATSVVPSFTTVTHAEAAAGVAANVGAYVQRVTKLALAITGASAGQGASLNSSSYKIEVAGQTINSVSGTSGEIMNSGTVAIKGTVTDSRGRTVSKTVNVTVMKYDPPRYTAIQARRALSTGVLNDEGDRIRVDINAAVESLVVGGTQRNALRYRITTRPHGSTSESLRVNQLTTSVTFNSFVTVSFSPNHYSVADAFDVIVEIVDDFFTTTVLLTVPVAKVFMHWDGSAGVGIGKYRELGALDVDGDVYVKGGLVDPVGSVTMFAGGTVPTGWLLCNGQAISRTTYAALFASIGTTYGAGNGSTTFNVPNLLGRVPVGMNEAELEFDARGKTGGAKTHTLTVAEIPSHSHSAGPNSNGFTAHATGGGGYAVGFTNAGAGEMMFYRQPASSGGGGAHPNLQPYIALHFIIRT